MKHFEVRMTMLVAVTVSVEAENAEAAEKLAMEKTGREEAYYLSKYDSVWDREVIEVNECEPEEEQDGMAAGLAYVREQLEQDELDEIKAQIDRSYRYHMNPSDCCAFSSRVEELLEEYGEDNDLPEGWWMYEGDIDDWLLKL
jgi:hypothetical protein